jgi:hypothetical protein
MKKTIVALSLTLTLALSGCMVLPKKDKDADNSHSTSMKSETKITESMTQTTAPPTTTTTTTTTGAPSDPFEEAEPSQTIPNGQIIESADKDPAKRRLYVDTTQLEINEINFTEDIPQEKQELYAKEMMEGYAYTMSWVLDYFNGDMKETDYDWIPEVAEVEGIDKKEMHENFANLFLQLKSAGYLPVMDQNDIELTKMEEADDFDLVRVTYPWVDSQNSVTYHMVVVVNFDNLLSGFATTSLEAQ